MVAGYPQYYYQRPPKYGKLFVESAPNDIPIWRLKLTVYPNASNEELQVSQTFLDKRTAIDFATRRAFDPNRWKEKDES
jgi:hypothetical protein